jgi:hypothetical protein
VQDLYKSNFDVWLASSVLANLFHSPAQRQWRKQKYLRHPFNPLYFPDINKIKGIPPANHWMKKEDDDVEPAATFQIRSGRKDPSDAIFIAEAFDASISYLNSIGSGSQWGTKKKSEDAAFVTTLEQYLSDSIEKPDQTGFYIAAKSMRDDDLTACGGAVVLSALPDYVRVSSEAMSVLNGLVNFDFLQILIADQRVQPHSRGVGSALIQYVKQEARRKGRAILLVDCWDGNNGLLVK